MNEFMVIVRMLTRPGSPMGAGVDDLLDALGLPEDVGPSVLFRLLAALHRLLSPLGLLVRFNPVTQTFFLDTRRVRTPIGGLPLPDRLAATLVAVIVQSYVSRGWVSIDQIRDVRGKTPRGIREDLRQLADLGYVELDRGQGQLRARPGVRLTFEVDVADLFRRLSEMSRDAAPVDG